MRKVLAIGVGLLLAGCASMRGVEVGSGGDASASYAIQVTNNRGSSVQISYTDGGARIQLGTVAAGNTERFIIASPQSTSITVYASNSSGTNVGNFPVTLAAGTTTRITVR